MTVGDQTETARRVLVLNGPNLGRLGKREPSVYGTATYADLAVTCRQAGRELGFDVEVRQTEYEGELITWIHEACDNAIPVVLNAGAFTHYSYAVMDAVKMRTAPLVEVHLSNISAREDFRHQSVITGAATGIIAGFGLHSYVLALHAIAAQIAESAQKEPLIVRPLANTAGEPTAAGPDVGEPDAREPDVL
jgi:3-dehydroquinate dehydratase II